MPRQGRNVQPTGSVPSEVQGANRVALSTRQPSNTRHRDDDPMANGVQGNPGGMEGVEVGEEVTTSDTTAEIEMRAAASND